MLQMLKPVFEKHNFQVFNCNPESKCDVFKYVPFEEAIDDCKGCVPKEPFDLSEWYNKGLEVKQREKYPEQMTQEEIIKLQRK